MVSNFRIGGKLSALLLWPSDRFWDRITSHVSSFTETQLNCVDKYSIIFIIFEQIAATQCDLTFDRETPEILTLRAYLGSKYEPHDDDVVMSTVLTALEGMNFECLSYPRDDHISQLTIRFNEIGVVHNDRNYWAGLRITNSESGQSAVWIEPVVITNAYTLANRRVLLDQKADIRTVHRTEFSTERVQRQVQFAKDL